MSERELKRELVEFCALAYRRKLVAGGGGNISVRGREEKTFYVTPSGVSLRDMTLDRILTVDQEGVKVEGPEHLRPSMETRMHLSVYEARPEVGAVVHLHPVHCIALVNTGLALDLASVSAEMLMGRVGQVEDYPAGSPELAEGVAQALTSLGPSCHTVFLRRHGVLSCGSSIREAFDRVETAEEMAQVLYLTLTLQRAAGQGPAET